MSSSSMLSRGSRKSSHVDMIQNILNFMKEERIARQKKEEEDRKEREKDRKEREKERKAREQ